MVPSLLPTGLIIFLALAPNSQSHWSFLIFPLVPSDVVHIAVAVISRLVFEALQRHLKTNGSPLPTVLVLEEAHSFIRKDADIGASAPSGRFVSSDVRAHCTGRSQIRAWADAGLATTFRVVPHRPRPVQLVSVAPHCQRCRSKPRSKTRAGRARWAPGRATNPSLTTGHSTGLGCFDAHSGPRARSGKTQRPRSDDPAFWATWLRQAGVSPDWPALVPDWEQALKEDIPVGGAAPEDPGSA